ncbi:MAG: hypothetical protein D4R63_09065 [Methylococcaceae bacterium]|nr:MAG: hypothetical protein D4R63_09065 [Methylococcaceae bacterium]
MHKSDLPYLTQDRLDYFFTAVYDAEVPSPHKDAQIVALLTALKAMQHFNHFHRSNDTREFFTLLNDIFNFERNSEGTTLWLALILAIKELYGFSPEKLRELMKLVTIRK